MRFRRQKQFILILSLIAIVFLINVGKYSSLASGTTSTPIDGLEILYLVGEDFDEAEYFAASELFERLGCGSTITAPTSSVHSLSNAVFSTDVLVTAVVLEDYDCIFVPGGGGPDNLITVPAVLTLIQDANALNMCLAAICAGPLVFAAADIVAGKNITGYPTIGDEVTAAGGYFSIESCIVDGNLVTASYPQTYACCMGVLQVLGVYEEDPPTVGSIDYTFTPNGENFNCEFEFQLIDTFGIYSTKIYAFRLSADGSSRTFFKQAILSDENEDGVYNCTITGFETYDYEIKLEATDGINNKYTNETILTLNPAASNPLGLNFGIVCCFFVIFVLPIILIKRPKK